MSALDVSVPCGSCSEPIRFGMDQCGKCSAEVSEDLRSALHARLEASSSDYRELVRHTRGATTVLVILGGFHLLLAAVAAFTSGPEGSLASSLAMLYGLVATSFLAFAAVARKATLLALVGGIAVWFAYNAWLVALDPRNLISGMFPKVVSFVLLVRGAVSAYSARQTLRQMSSSSGATAHPQ